MYHFYLYNERKRNLYRSRPREVEMNGNFTVHAQSNPLSLN